VGGAMETAAPPPAAGPAGEAPGAAVPTQPAGPAAGRPAGGEGSLSRSSTGGLRVVWVKPRGVVPVFPHAVIELGFSAPMDPALVEEAFAIWPEVPGTLEWPRADQIVFRPRRHLEMGAEYRVRVLSSAQDLRHQESLAAYEWTFQVHRTYSFRHNVGRIIRHGCGPCHRPGGWALQVPLDNYEQVMKYVRKENAASSRLVTVLSEPQNHGQVPPDWRAMVYVLRDWIERFDAAE